MDSLLSSTALQRPDVYRLFLVEGQLISVASQFGLQLKKGPESAWMHLSASPAELVQYVTKQLSDILENLLICARENINPWDDGEFFRLSMKRMGLTYPPDFMDYVQDEDLLEGYDMNRFQIFRNLRFMERSSYSLLEILSYEWPILFERATAITQKLMSFCDDILWKANKTIVFDIPRHYIRELRSSEKQVLQVEFKYLSPLFSGPNRPFGILATCRAKPIDAADPIDKLSFV